MNTIVNSKGYGVLRSELTEEQERHLKETLTVRPNIIPDYDFGDVKPYPVYRFNTKRYYVPKYWGIQQYGLPTEVKEQEGDDVHFKFNGKLRDYQQKFMDTIHKEVKDKGSAIACAKTGQGKCHAINTPILMYNGSIKMVQDIVVGDLLMGDDSEPRKVLSLGRGEDTMYEVIPTKGDSYTFNSEHILCLKCTGLGISKIRNKWFAKYFDKTTISIKSRGFSSKEEAGMFSSKFTEEDNICHITIKDYLKLSKTLKHVLKLYRKGVEFDHKDVPFDPYIIGLWIGDGHSYSTQISTQDSSVIVYLKKKLQEYDLYLDYKTKYDYIVLGGKRFQKGANQFLSVLKLLGLLRNKHIPELYKINSREVRLQLLAGLIDSDGYNAGGFYEFVQKNKEIADDVAFLARSLGFAAYVKKKNTSWKYEGVKKTGIAYRVIINGKVEEIPVKIKRKKCQRKQIKNVLVTGFKVVEKPRDKYYGFEIDGNHRYLLGDFTVTHNTVMTLWLTSQLKKRTLIIVHKQFLMDQWVERIKQFLPEASIGIIKQDTIEIDNDIVIGMIQSITQREYEPGTFDRFGFVAWDECHHVSSRTFSKSLFKAKSLKTLGLSATPKRKDGLTKVIEWFLGDIIVNHKDSDIDTPMVKFVSSEYSSELKPKYNWKKKLITSNMETQIAADEGRTKQIVEEILKFSKLGRKILVLSSRRGHCETMKDFLEKHPLFDPEKNLKTVGLYLGGMKEAELTESNKSDVILATYSMAYEGYDNPDLDTLVMATGRGDIEQACGRILRKRNKFRPLVIDFTDILYFGGQLRRRKQFYKKKDYVEFETEKPFKKILKEEKKCQQPPDEPLFL